MTPSAIAAFAAQSAALRRQIWASSITPTGGSAIVAAKSPTKITRQANEIGSGFVQRAIAVFMIAQDIGYVPAIGAEWVLSAHASNPSEIGSRWRCFDCTASELGAEFRCACFRLD
jgi:hypothetical protein